MALTDRQLVKRTSRKSTNNVFVFTHSSCLCQLSNKFIVVISTALPLLCGRPPGRPETTTIGCNGLVVSISAHKSFSSPWLASNQSSSLPEGGLGSNYFAGVNQYAVQCSSLLLKQHKSFSRISSGL